MCVTTLITIPTISFCSEVRSPRWPRRRHMLWDRDNWDMRLSPSCQPPCLHQWSPVFSCYLKKTEDLKTFPHIRGGPRELLEDAGWRELGDGWPSHAEAPSAHAPRAQALMCSTLLVFPSYINSPIMIQDSPNVIKNHRHPNINLWNFSLQETYKSL